MLKPLTMALALAAGLGLAACDNSDQTAETPADRAVTTPSEGTSTMPPSRSTQPAAPAPAAPTAPANPPAR